jgi:hypothetical protein
MHDRSSFSLFVRPGPLSTPGTTPGPGHIRTPPPTHPLVPLLFNSQSTWMLESALSTPGTPDRVCKPDCGMSRDGVYKNFVVILTTDPDVAPSHAALFFKTMAEKHQAPAERFLRVESSTRTLMPLSMYLFQPQFASLVCHQVYAAAHPYIKSYAFLLDSDRAGWTCAHVICAQHNTDGIAFLSTALAPHEMATLFNKCTVNGETPLWTGIAVAATYAVHSPKYTQALDFLAKILALNVYSAQTLRVIAAEAARIARGSAAQGIARNPYVLAITDRLGIVGNHETSHHETSHHETQKNADAMD